MADENENRYRGIPELKNRKLKEEAVSFYAQHNVRETLENLLNAMFPDKPGDVYGYMVRLSTGYNMHVCVCVYRQMYKI